MTGYKSSGYNLDKMELTWLWLDAQAERMNRKETKKNLPMQKKRKTIKWIKQ